MSQAELGTEDFYRLIHDPAIERLYRLTLEERADDDTDPLGRDLARDHRCDQRDRARAAAHPADHRA